MNWCKFFVICWIFICVSASWGKTLSFQGLNTEEVAEIQRQLPALKTNQVTLALADEALQLVMKMKRFESVQIQQKGPEGYVLVATPLRTVENIYIRGNRAASRSDLLDLIDISSGENFERRRILEVGERLKQYYGELGFFNTVIEVDFKTLDDRKMDLEFKITEGLPCRITQIDFRSKNAELNQRLKALTRNSLNKNLTSQQTNRLVEKIRSDLMNRSFFSTSLQGPTTVYNDDKSQVQLIFELADPYQYQIFLEGVGEDQSFNKSPSLFRYQEIPREKRHLPTENEVRRAIAYTNEERSSLDPDAEMSNKIRAFYLQKGYPEVKITTNKETIETQFLRRITFQIETGPKVRIRNWIIEGRISRAQEYYINFILENSSELIRRGYYNREDLSLGERNMITELRNQGFLMAKIQSTRIEYLGKTKAQAIITLNIDEGPLTQVRRLTFVGNQEFSDVQLENMFLIKSNSPLRLQNLEKSIEDLKKFYLDQGYLEMKILNDAKSIVQYNDKGTHANVEIRIYEGPKITVKAIVVEGHEKTKESVIRKALSFAPGDVLTPEMIEDSTLYLNRTGIFSRVAITTLEQGTDVGPRTVVVSVTERDPGLWRLGMGVNSERELTARAFTGLSYNNIGGTARGVSSRVELSSNVADLNYLEHRITAGYLEPFLFNTKVKGRINLTRSDEVFNTYKSEIGDQQLIEILTRNRVDFLLESDLSRELKLTWTLWGLDSRTNREVKYRCPEDPNLFCPETTLQIANIGPILDLDYRDNPFMPTEGNYTRFATDYSAPWLASSSGVEFIKVDGTYRHYFPFSYKRIIWANEFRSGYLANLSSDPDSGVPTSHAFFLGSYSTVRGYDFTNDNNRIPKGTNQVDPDFNNRLPVTSANEKIIKSDSYYYMVKTEVRFPISGDFGGVIFYDGGAVLVSGYEFDDPYRESIGFGFRYNTPVGPVSMDLGFKLDRQEDESLTDFHFSIGTF